jgi:hypothetical protein
MEFRLRYGLVMRFLIPGALVVLSVLVVAPAARAQFEVPPGPLHKFPAVDLDGGIAYASRGTDWTYFGRASAGLHLINRQRIVAFTGGCNNRSEAAWLLGKGDTSNAPRTWRATTDQ